jgi:hypothetical protein
MITLYSLRTDGSGHRITKFVDGEPEGSYLVSREACECPAGHRSTCRHRQMLPQLLAEGIANTHWFWNFDLHRVVDFDGMLKSNFDAMNELAQQREEAADENESLFTMGPIGNEVVGEAQHVEEIPPGDYTAEVDKIKTYPDGQVMMTFKNVKPWRRL